MHDPLLQPFNGIKDGKMYRLVVEQQPVRARMCGFGDKDRRPITPPPCVRLIVSDYATGKEIDANDIDSTFFVLTVDLWDADGGREVNLVRHSSGAPTVSISSSTTTSYPPAPERTVVYAPQVMAPLQTDAYGRPMPPYQSRPMPGYGGYPPPHNHGAFPYAGGPAYPPSVPMTPIATPASNVGMFTRNLIGSLAVNAFKLNDTNDKLGFWFVLQDLSVRTEGSFRLKMNFVDVGANVGNNTLNTERAPVLATCFSEPFQVFSAKKFPGVIESTPLSKTFAQQGIKIPIRKDGPKSLQNAAEYDD
ncbi:hypothetical protein BU23DRAFT_569996 [Bimuria novae-zelandiae CBS 107.79]|uniref:Velvet domain-containing protein n=1 Tax=Bimuria novae-zelandiae CBS 107.79 TaxID=1447943 RepID=A0A6A5V3B4_9PLEO|nr:hypothetical protein BU23DRAFT_569996 [Bimuria novae-zelandiae CBS 107.79]